MQNRMEAVVMATRRSAKWLLPIAATLIAAAVAWHLGRASSMHAEGDRHTSMMRTRVHEPESDLPLVNSQHRQADLRKAPVSAPIDVSTPAAKTLALSQLTGQNKKRWVDAQRKFFPSLTVAEIWDVLVAPGIAEQMQAKAMRSDFLRACERYGLGRSVDPPAASDDAGSGSLVQEQCAILQSRGDREYFLRQAGLLDGDKEFQSSDFRVPAPDFSALTAEQFDAQQALEEGRISQRYDPWLAARGFTDLWQMRSTGLLADWAEIDRLAGDERSQLMQTIATDVACRMIGRCAANSSWTLMYCSRVSMARCAPKMDFDDIVQRNLTPAQLNLRQTILNNLSDRFLN